MNSPLPARKREPDAAIRNLVPVRQALSGLIQGLDPIDPVEIALADGQHAVLAEPLRVASAIPGAALALRPGYAVRASDTFGASAYSPVVLLQSVSWVAAGSPLPPGTDAVLEAGAARLLAGRTEIADSIAPGAGTRRAGEDATAGAVLREVGLPLRAVDLACAAAAGISRVMVRRPRLLTAETLTDPAALACADLVARLAEADGARVVRRPAGDLRDEPADAMVVIGDPEALRATLPPSAGIVAGQLALRPGEDGVLARLAAIPILFVPPRLEAALALSLAILRPVLVHLAGALDEPAPQSGPLARKLVSTVGLSEIALLRRAGAGWDPVATGDLPLAAIAAADAWLTLEPGQEGYPAGHVVAARPL